jgi:hypothetical protein
MFDLLLHGVVALVGALYPLLGFVVSIFCRLFCCRIIMRAHDELELSWAMNSTSLYEYLVLKMWLR